MIKDSGFLTCVTALLLFVDGSKFEYGSFESLINQAYASDSNDEINSWSDGGISLNGGMRDE